MSMNTSQLQAFATQARHSLMNAVNARLEKALAPNSDVQVNTPGLYKRLTAAIEQHGGGKAGKNALVERHAYRWFNRIIALRYMDVHEFTTMPVVSPADLVSENALPEVLAAARRGEYDEDVFESTANAKLRDKVEGLFDGTVTSADAQGEAYGLLLQAYCRYWHKFLPFMFDDPNSMDCRLDEVLMPADLLAEGSVLRNAVKVMTPEACGATADDESGNVEVIGWLYQFYIAELKSEVMDGFKKSRKAGATEIAPATQLFTPDWIVRYLVQNTVGRLWMQNHPDCMLYRQWEYYIRSNGSDQPEEFLHISSPEELTVCDPACGSGHMLTYAFDLLYSIYESEGYSPSEIPGLILEHNLYGMEIDERAANLAAFVLTMKARGRYRRFFRKQVAPHIRQIRPIEFTHDQIETLNDTYGATLTDSQWNTYSHADVYGSLIQPDHDLAAIANTAQDAASNLLLDADAIEHAKDLFEQTRYLSRKYAVIVANPPYMGSNNMGAQLKNYVNKHYEDGKSDLFAAFILRNLHFIHSRAMLGMVTMQSWMFLSSFENMRRMLLKTITIDSMAHLGAGAFDSIGSEVVSTTAFILRNASTKDKGTYLRLVDISGDDNQAEACNNASTGSTENRYIADQQNFEQIPGSPIVYWLSEPLLRVFNKKIAKGVSGDALSDIADVAKGITTGDNARFLRFWWEASHNQIDFTRAMLEEKQRGQWVPCDKGGEFRRWYGNNLYIVNWKENGQVLFNFPRATPRNRDITFLESIACTYISGSISFRYHANGFAFNGAAVAVTGTNHLRSVHCFLNSSTAYTLMSALSPTTNFEVGQLSSLPFHSLGENLSDSNERALVSISKEDWDSYEASWDYQHNLLVSTARESDGLLHDLVQSLYADCQRSAVEQQQREVLNNELVADAYGVRDEVPCDVPLERVSLKRNPAFAYPKASDEEREQLFTVDAVKELISYAVGCMFGRYSLDKPGLILASQGETLDDYYARVGDTRFEPDEDNVIPVTGVDCFEDDIVARFRRYLKVAFGEEQMSQNVAFIEQVLGKSLRAYFVNDFYDDHVRRYSNRPIYWQYSSRTDKKGSFKALVYLHRYTPHTTDTVLAYLRDYTSKIGTLASQLEQSGKTKDKQESVKLRKAVAECKEYEDQTLYPLATRNLPIDLDDGVLVNYLRLGKALRTINTIEKKRKDVSSWTWPHYPLGSTN